MLSFFGWKSEKASEGGPARKRQRVETETAEGEPAEVLKHEVEFTITFGCHGNIKLCEEALRAFPSSLLSSTLLDGGIGDHALYVPIGRGYKPLLDLIKDVYDCGAPSFIPPSGVHFDLFVKWLRYLWLATSGRSLSTETEANKRVSYFVETLFNTAFERFASDPPLHRPPSGSYTIMCVGIPPDITRYISFLVPFEFARRGIHVIVEKLSGTLNRDYVNCSTLVVESEYLKDGFRLKSHPLSIAAGVVTGVYLIEKMDEGEPMEFQHGGHEYEMRWIPFDGRDRNTINLQLDLVRCDAGAHYEGETKVESLLILENRGINLVGEFKRGGMVYSEEEYGKTLLDLHWSQDGESRELHTPFIDGIRGNTTATKKSKLKNAYLVIIACDAHPTLKFLREDTSSGSYAIPWRFTMQESPEWALVRD